MCCTFLEYRMRNEVQNNKKHKKLKFSTKPIYSWQECPFFEILVTVYQYNFMQNWFMVSID